MVIINIVFFGYIVWLGVVPALDATRKEEKTIWVAIAATVVLTPVGVLFPGIRGFVQGVRTGLFLIAFLAALALFVSLWGEPASQEPI